ncbi:hypothetical protein amyaer_0156 [Microcystis aeruginosa NIES-2481]|nr:hypothetical protein amyaer_0156 [Microcystis aeruginosa NIES-2481]
MNHALSLAIAFLPNFIVSSQILGLKPHPFRTALSYNGKSDNQAKN